MSRYIFSKNNRWYISQVFDPSDSQLQEKASYYTLTDDVTGPYYATGTSDSVSIGVSYVPVVEPVSVSLRAGVIVSDGGTLKVQPLSFDGTIPSDSGALESLSDSSLLIFNTGHGEPDYGGSVVPGASMDFYKCTYVNSDSWGGQKIIFNGQYYEFESNSTEGLTYYPSKKVPAVNKIYTEDALVQVAGLFTGNSVLLYIPLTSSAAAAATGQQLTYNGSIDFDQVSWHVCGIFQSGDYVQTDATYPSTEKSICMKMIIDDTNDWKTFLTYGSFYKTVAGNYDANYNELYWNPGTWYSYILIFADGQLREYLDGQLKATRNWQQGIPNGTLKIGGQYFRGKVYDVKVFPFALSADQITQEAEF